MKRMALFLLVAVCFITVKVGMSNNVKELSRCDGAYAAVYSDGYNCELSAHEASIQLRAVYKNDDCHVTPADEIIWEQKLPGGSWQQIDAGTDIITPDGCKLAHPICITQYHIRAKMRKGAYWYTSNEVYVNFPYACFA